MHDREAATARASRIGASQRPKLKGTIHSPAPLPHSAREQQGSQWPTPCHVTTAVLDAARYSKAPRPTRHGAAVRAVSRELGQAGHTGRARRPTCSVWRCRRRRPARGQCAPLRRSSRGYCGHGGGCRRAAGQGGRQQPENRPLAGAAFARSAAHVGELANPLLGGSVDDFKLDAVS